MLITKAVFQLFLLSLLKLAKCDVLVYKIKTHEIEIEFKDVPSKFGGTIPPDGLTGLLVYSKPSNACTTIDNPPHLQNYTGKWIVLIRRYDCQFEQKVKNAQLAGFDAAIVHNVESSVLIFGSGATCYITVRSNFLLFCNHCKLWNGYENCILQFCISEPMAAADNPHGISIPSIFVGSESGYLMEKNYLYDQGYFILITDDIPFNFTSQLLIIFSVLIGFCFFVMIFFLIVKYFKDRRRQRRYCLPKSCLKEIAIHKFKKNDPYEICAICLEEYVENDKLRVLPCSHAYHSKCIDPWLTKSRRVCPVCKRKVFTSGEAVVESDSDTEDETAPLVRSRGNTTNTGTFTTPMENPLRRWSSSDSGSGFSSTPTSPSSRNNSVRSVPEAPRHSRRTGGVVEVRDIPQDYSINSGPIEIGRASRQRSRNDTERC